MPTSNLQLNTDSLRGTKVTRAGTLSRLHNRLGGRGHFNSSAYNILERSMMNKLENASLPKIGTIWMSETPLRQFSESKNPPFFW